MVDEPVALVVSDISKVFDDGFSALSGIDLSVTRGEFLTLLGPSGCGKTTLLKTIAGFHNPTSGRIELSGKDITENPPEKRDMAMCFQSYALFPHLSVADNIDFGPRQNAVSRPERLERLERLLSQVDLEVHREKLPNKLSGGQQQRVALARALAMQPAVVLFDEPLSNLDAKLRDQVRREIRGLQQELGFTAIYVTHDQSEALSMSDRVVVMRNGQIDQIGTPEDVYNRPATAFVADFIGAANILPFEGGTDGHVTTPIGPLPVKEPPDASASYVVWRPEDAEPCAPEDAGAIAAEITERAYQGAYTELHVRVGNSPEQRLHLPHAHMPVDARISFRVPSERIRFVTGEIA
ncbi:MAG: ABC transporter ATP-binding protein [Pseudomonadota bacterium]